MSDLSEKIICQFVTPQGMEEINRWVAKYPAEEKQSAVMAALMVVQKEHGHLTPDLMDVVAEYLDMPPVAVYEVATFYTMYEHKPHGRHLVNVCTNISCKLRNAEKIVHHLEQKWGIKVGETTPDGRYTLRAVECLAACVNAPMMQVNQDTHENLTTKNLDLILERYE